MGALGQLGVLLFLAAILVIALLALYIAGRARQTEDDAEHLNRMVPDARTEDYERPSSLLAEQIEEMVIQKLMQYDDLKDVVLDFGSMPDGTIDIWVNKKQYDDPEDIPDERIRSAIKEAVDTFNQRPM